MEFTLTTPALLFPAISLLMLAYTQRFLHLAALMRELYNRYKVDPDPKLLGQISNLKYRLRIIRNEQVFGAASFFLCAVSMFLIFVNQQAAAKWVFGLGLILLILSLALSLREVQVSIEALQLEVEDIEKEKTSIRRKVPKGGAYLPAFKAVHPVLPARDVKKAVTYYRDRLGFQLQFQDDPDDPKYAGVRRGSVELHLQWHDEVDFNKVERLALRFVIDDVDSLFAEYQDKDVFHSATKLQNTTWGTREFAFFDLNGNGLFFYRDLE